MTVYRYKALGKEGSLQKGVLEASSSLELKTRLQELGFSLITYSRGVSFFIPQKINSHVLMDLCFHLEQFENAGIPLKESLEELYQAQSVPILKSTLAKVIKDLEEGVLFSRALAKHSFAFDPIFVGLIMIGEKTGHLSFVFHQLFLHLKWKDEVHAQTFKALRYPLIMASVFLIVVFILMTVLVPELVIFIKNFSVSLPLSTLFLIALSDFLSKYLLLLCLAVSLHIFLLLALFKVHPKGDLWKDRLLATIPLIGPLRRKIVLARFCHVFAVLFESGIDILEALRTARQSLHQGQLSHALEEIETFIKEGFSLSSAFHRASLFPPIVIRMVKIGEQTSSLQKTFLHVKEYLDISLKRQIEHTIGFIEPLIILSLGAVMMWIVYSVFLPLYHILSTLDC